MRKSDTAANRDLLGGFIRRHSLQHAAKEPLVGQWTIGEPRRHGYSLTRGWFIHPPGDRQQGYLRSVEKRSGKGFCREYRATPAGRSALVAAKTRSWTSFPSDDRGTAVITLA